MIAEGVGEGEVGGGSILYLVIQCQVRAIAVKTPAQTWLQLKATRRAARRPRGYESCHVLKHCQIQVAWAGWSPGTST